MAVPSRVPIHRYSHAAMINTVQCIETGMRPQRPSSQ
jgi:hypothetical protein